MLQVNTIRENKEKVIEGLAKRGIKNVEELLQTVLEADQHRKDTQRKLDDLKARSNTDSILCVREAIASLSGSNSSCFNLSTDWDIANHKTPNHCVAQRFACAF